MSKLIYSAIASLDGFVTDAEGNFDWAAPGDEMHQVINNLERRVGTYLYGRRMYETMIFWETAHSIPDAPAVIADYADVWRAADKVVYSATIGGASSERTTIRRTFDPDDVRSLIEASKSDVSIGGATIAAAALAADLVDEIQAFIVPVAVGAGTRFLPAGVRLDLHLLDERRFENGAVLLRYRVRR